MVKVQSSISGYPRIGGKREWKRALESFWNGATSEEQLLKTTETLRLESLQKQKEFGIDLIPVGDFSLYDHVLDTSIMFGVVPTRFEYTGGKVPLETYFAIARGTKDAVASEMTKWFNTNYHYIVPELEGVTPQLVENRPLAFYKEAKEKLGIDGKPVILGPVTYIKLAKSFGEENFPALLQQFTPLYIEVLKELVEAGAKWVQVDEPILTSKLSEEDFQHVQQAYAAIHEAVPQLKIILQTYFEKVANYEAVVALPVHGFGLDFVHGDSLELLQKYGFPQDKVLAAGVIDGRNVWRADLDKKVTLLEEIQLHVDKSRLIVQPSSSLLHVPVSTETEEKLDPIIKGGLSFADQKLAEIVLLSRGVHDGTETIATGLEESRNALARLNNSKYRQNVEVKETIENLTEQDVNRSLPFAERIIEQQKRFNLPLLPTTTIGSLPQTPEVRQTRSKWRKGEITNEAYEQFIKDQIDKWIEIQEDIGIDVLVHGEFERTDMVEYFGEKFEGFAVSQFGWVQSYGSRCVKPPLILGDVAFSEPITVKESVYAQTLTTKPVKGMLTGPVTILNWSFVRDDIPRFDVLNQIAFALRKEIEELEKNGIRMIQVDEPALREGLPLDLEKRESYLDAAVYAFKLATSSVENDTQIHTHMCYSEFSGIIKSISALDADVISIETSRSHGEIIAAFENNTYDKEIGLGVYDIHSPRVPSKEEMKQNINRALKTINPKQFWINPDCGLKTRKEEETIGALKIMVEAAKEVRESQLAVLKS
ncbi:5-methyltetrahydropteroyltriglutamate--homocysteine S-methyltransferase [Sporosarcina sp. E16_3]|uniref:5-methyltetrahydropteroyltriglutamate-- homocysteine S-methyltransferase n=1 Tax=Sporosarcina sp. E16_3 TaxID=2789293 RepID=UPI001A911B3D|nr:5-methyltetrahydropteroyltriglutamate--homocysteine S-methyltransferase [Sporosarcina sp. E16_3]MBO0602801.1 5-methyltetrahydropteroyltriglutamate--homocysteine S-methyltransferase [Sporosarcina sp. E16_3]